MFQLDFIRFGCEKKAKLMFRPRFCANCGEGIERVEWFPWTSRRFCPVCEIEFKGHETLIRVVAGLIIMFGLFGFGSYLKSGRSSESDLLTVKQQPRTLATNPAGGNKLVSNSSVTPPEPANSAVSRQPEQRNFSSTPGTQSPLPAVKRVVADDQVYYCGAETKKGTPCSRRVKIGNTRCYQHVGMPSIAASERPNVRSQK